MFTSRAGENLETRYNELVVSGRMCLWDWGWESASEVTSLLASVTDAPAHTQSSPSLPSQWTWRCDCMCKIPLLKFTQCKFSYGAKFRVLIRIHKILSQIPCPLLMSFPPSCLPSPELDHYLLSLHIFAHGSPSAWIFIFHVSARQMPAPLATLSSSINSLGTERGFSGPRWSPPSEPIAAEYNQLFLHWPPTLSSSVFAPRGFSKSDERVDSCFSTSIN